MRVDIAERFPDDCDPTLPGIPDPYPLYHRLRADDPVHWSPFANAWVLTRYADASAYLQDRRFSRVAFLDAMRAKFGDNQPILKFQSEELSFLDGDKHTRLKNLVGRAFTPQRITAMRPQICAAVEARLDELAPTHRIDIIGDYAYPLPADVISAMIGVPREDWPLLREWVDGIVLSRGLVRTPEMMAEGDRSARAFESYLRSLIARRKATPGDDLMSALIAAHEQGANLNEDQLVSMTETLFAAGHSTTRSLIGLCLLALLKNPAEMARLRATPELIASAVEETLRYDPPTQAPSPQAALEDVEIGGSTIRKGEAVSVLFGATNRDPARFPDPDRFDMTRSDLEHLAFSLGPHYCLGASLARAEAQIAIHAIVQRLPNLKLTGEPLRYQKAGRFRGLESLPVEF
ncbi:MAG: cytochrome P450 [Candidatus Binataceae bacterium]